MKLPTLQDHNNGNGFGFLDRRDYIPRYLEAKQIDATSYGELARLAFNLVQARYRLIDMNGTVATDNEQRIAAQECDVNGWQDKVDRYLGERVDRSRLFSEMVSDFTAMASVARQPDDAERERTEIGLAGQIGDVVVAREVFGYSWQDGPSGARDSAFAGEQKIV